MPRVVIVQVIYNNRKWIQPVFEAIFKQSFTDFKAVAVIAGNEDGGKEFLAEKFPRVEIIDPGCNIGFAKGHNLVFEKYDCEFFQLVNPDMIMSETYVEEMLKAFADESVGAATGKLYKIQDSGFKIKDLREKKLLDTTGVVIKKSGRAFDRGQHQIDIGQYDNSTKVQAVSAAGAMYRASALQSTSYYLPAKQEFFDEDFHSYWEDVDLAWRMSNKGWQCVFVPAAIGFHGRSAGSSRGGYFHVINFIKHHRALPERIRQLNYKNHIFMYVKNSPYFYPQFFAREFFMLIYILLFEISTLKILPDFFKLLPKIWKKRKLIYQ